MSRVATKSFLEKLVRVMPRADVHEIGREYLGLGRQAYKQPYEALVAAVVAADGHGLRRYVAMMVIEGLGLSEVDFGQTYETITDGDPLETE